MDSNYKCPLCQQNLSLYDCPDKEGLLEVSCNNRACNLPGYIYGNGETDYLAKMDFEEKLDTMGLLPRAGVLV